ncbi:COP23 domain-containing protein [Oscillatoria sp. CS-180]|nr:COP23 domain-containing protein [Oscillatoria sp. CS-180]
MAKVWQSLLSAGLVSSLSISVGLAGSDYAIAQTDPDTTTSTETEPSESSTETETPDTEDAEVPLPEDSPDVDQIARFSCQLENGEYTVMYSPRSEPGAMYAWATPEDMGSAWPAERRCEEISRRLESYRPDGLLELQTAMENGYNTVCVTTEAVSSCRIVFTVPQGQDPVLTRDRVFDNLVLADQGQATDGVNTFVEGDSALDGLDDILGVPSGSSTRGGINLQPFLDPADGGTGAQLNPNSGRSLDPNNF